MHGFKRAAVDGQVRFVPDRGAAVGITGDDFAAVDDHDALAQVFHAAGCDAAGTDAVHQRKGPVVIDGIQAAAGSFVFIHGDSMAVEVQRDVLACFHAQRRFQIDIFTVAFFDNFSNSYNLAHRR